MGHKTTKLPSKLPSHYFLLEVPAGYCKNTFNADKVVLMLFKIHQFYF